MTASRSFSLAAALVLCTATATAQAPANDNCANASVVAVGSNPFDSTGATTDGLDLLAGMVCDFGSFAADGQVYQDVWFDFTPGTTELFDIEVVNNGLGEYDTRIAIYNQSTCPDDPALVLDCDDDDGAGLLSLIEDVSLTAGTTYKVRVGTFSATTVPNGADLVITGNGAPPAAPANDNCANSTMAALGLTAFDSRAATEDGLALDDMVCGFTAGDDQLYQDVWFNFTPAASGNYDIGVANNGNPNWDSRLAIYNQSTCPDDPANVIACDDDDGPGLMAFADLVSLTGGTTYLIRVGSFSATTTEELASLEIANSPPPPANDDCGNASVAVLGANALDTNTATTDGVALDPMVCDLDAGADERIYNDVWFTFAPATTGSYTMDTDNGNDFDTRMAVYSSTACPANPADVIACDDDTLGTASEVIVNLTAGTTYLIRVGSDDPTDRGIANLTIADTPPAPGNDNCANATTVMTGSNPFNADGATTDGLDILSGMICDFGSFAADGQVYQDVWYDFTPATSELFDIEVVNNGLGEYDTRIVIYNQSTCPDDPALVLDCDDDDGAGLLSLMSGVSLTAGTTYKIRVGTFSATTTINGADLVITAAGPPPTPAPNDNCANATVAMVGANPLDNVISTTDGLDMDGVACNFAVGTQSIFQDVWFSFTPGTSALYDIEVTNNGGTFDSRIAIYDQGTCPDDPANVIACSDDEDGPLSPGLLSFMDDVNLMAGSTYLIRVGTFSATTVPVPTDLSILQDGVPPGPVFPDLCNGDGGDQMGCSDCPCGNNAMAGTIGGCLNSAGTSTRLAATGDPSISLPSGDTTDLRFTVTGSPPMATNVLLSGNAVAPQGMANPCFGLDSGVQSSDRDGLRCSVQVVVRHGNRAANAMGEIMDSTGPNRVWGGEAQPTAGIGVQGGFMAGQTRYFQITHRDDALAVCLRGLNTSQAVEVTFTP